MGDPGKDDYNVVWVQPGQEDENTFLSLESVAQPSGLKLKFYKDYIRNDPDNNMSEVALYNLKEENVQKLAELSFLGSSKYFL